MNHLRKIVLMLHILILSGCGADVLEEQGTRELSYLPVAASSTVVFIHGMYLTPLVWQEWESLFQDSGFNTYSPAWPQHDLSVAEQNAIHPSSALAELTLPDVLQYYREYITALEEPPILIGHSMGGLIVQILLSEGLGAAGIAINSAPPQGVISANTNFLKANWPHINPFLSPNKPTQLTFKQFAFGIVNDMDSEIQINTFSQYAVPESRRVGKATLTNDAAIDIALPRAPLLILAGGNDRMIPASLNYTNFKKYRSAASITDYKQFRDRNHWTILQPEWESLADYIQEWLGDNSVNQ